MTAGLRGLFVTAASLAFLLPRPAAADVWSDSYDPQTKTRFIPVELWTGSAWDGARTINMLPANLRFGGGKTIRGLFDWPDPITGTMRQVYQRSSPRGKGVTVIQVFAIRDDETGIGRLWDSRREDHERGESKFPLGLWTEGEARTYTIETFNPKTKRANKTTGHVTITMERIDHRDGVDDHCLTFRWQKTMRDKMIDNNGYTYCPDKGLVSLDDD